MIRCALAAAVFVLAAVSAEAATGPAAPQAGANAGVYVAPGDGLFVDAFGVARFVTNGAVTEFDIPTFSAAEWTSFRTNPPVGAATQYGACPPTTVSLCNGATVVALPTPAIPPGFSTSFANPNGYGVQGQTASVSATCIDPWGLPYGDSKSATCGLASGTGPSAVWSWQLGGDVETCTANAHSSVSGCSASCGPGTVTTTIFDSCGNATGNSAAACNLGPCCTTNYEKTGCSGSSAVMTDEGSCHGASYLQPGGCTWVSKVVGGSNCSFSVPDYAPGGISPSGTSYTEFWDCGGPGLSGDSWVPWGTGSGPGISCSSSCSNGEPYITVTNGVETGHGNVCGINSIVCTFSGYQ